MLARLRAIIRRDAGQTNNVIRCGELSVNTATSDVHLRGKRVDLTATEYRLLHHLLINRERTASATELADAIYSHNHDRDSNAIEAIVARLRKKLGPGLIEPRRGFGYRIAGS